MKVKCGTCSNMMERKCMIKKVTVSPNKARRCAEYNYDELKEITRLERKARSMDQQDTAYKQTLAHPVTGDLSKFKTTATK